MLIDRKARGWIVFSILVLLVATAVYVLYAQWAHAAPQPDRPVRRLSGGTWVGLGYGVAGTLMILFAWLLWFKKFFRTRIMGKATTWMQGHVWLGLLAYPIIWYHACFRWGGPLTMALMIIFTLVFVTGIIGLWFQGRVPTKIMRDVPRETIAEQIDHVIVQLQKEAALIVERVMARRKSLNGDEDGAVATLTETTEGEKSLQAFYTREIVPLLDEKFPRRAKLSSAAASVHAFRSLRDSVPADLRDAVTDLESIVDERRQFERQRHLQFILHSWLLVHVPLSYAMIVLVVLHVVYAMKYATLPF